MRTALLLTGLAEGGAGDWVFLGVIWAACGLSWAACSSHVEIQLAGYKDLLLMGVGQVGLGYISTASTLVALTGVDPGTGRSLGVSTRHWEANLRG